MVTNTISYVNFFQILGILDTEGKIIIIAIIIIIIIVIIIIIIIIIITVVVGFLFM